MPINVRGTCTLRGRETLRFGTVWLQTILRPVINTVLFVVVRIAPLTMLAGTFYSVSSLAEPFRSISFANPVVHMVDAFRAAFTGSAEVDPAWTLAGLALANVVFGAVAVRMFPSGYRPMA